MISVERFDVLILGSGQGGKLLAWHLARSGKTVAVVERRWVGGSCPAVACLPSKNELFSARVAHVVRNAGNYGVETGAVSVDMTRVRRRKQDMIDREIAFHLSMYKESGAELIMGTGRFIAARTIEVLLNDGGVRRLEGSEVVINVGTHAAIPDVPGLAAAEPLTHVEALELDCLPAHLIVLGGGYTGVEFAQAFRRFGSEVTLIEPGPRLMGREDAEVGEELRRILTAEGVNVLLSGQPMRVSGASGAKVAIEVAIATGEQTVKGSHLLVATGRVPNTADIGLDDAGIERDLRGFIRVSDRLETTASGVWAIGECAGSPQFTYVSVDDFRIVRDNMGGGDRRTSDRIVPHVTFTDPPLARVGLSEADAKNRGLNARVGYLPMSIVLRTEATDEFEGFMKIVVSGEDDRILGFTMVGSEAGEVMTAIQTAMLSALPYTKLRDAVIAHLTVSEGLGPLLANVPARHSTRQSLRIVP